MQGSQNEILQLAVESALFFWFDLFLQARAEILEKISFFLSKRWHQKDILKLTDL